MTREELTQFDGQDGRKAYVAVSGTVYDFTASKMWQGGEHQGLHRAGCDLTEELKSAPHVRAVIERFSVVGQVEEAVPAKQSAGRGKTAGIVIGIIVIAVIAFIALR